MLNPHLHVHTLHTSSTCVSFQTDPRKAENFEEQFRSQPVRNTKTSKDGQYILDHMNGDEFGGFSFVNPNYMVFGGNN